jgi:radical SAM superfamily enzyme YgiQ (UPF0313 family)
MWGGYHGGDVEEAIREIKAVQADYGVRYFAFHDLMLNASPQKLHELARRIIEEQIDAHFYGMMSIVEAEHDFALLRRAGFIEVGIGIEVPTDQRREIGKGSGFETVKKFVKGLTDAGIFVRGLFIVGWPWEESARSVREMYRFALREIPVNALRVHFLTPFPGTDVWQKFYGNYTYADQGEEGYKHLTTMEPVLRFQLTTEALVEVRQNILRDYYGSRSYADLIGRQTEWPVSEMNTAYADHVLSGASTLMSLDSTHPVQSLGGDCAP